MTYLLIILAYLPNFLLGFIIANHFWKETDLPSVILKLALGVPIGLAINTSIFFVAMLLGIQPDIYCLSEFILSMILVSVWVYHNREHILKFCKAIEFNAIFLASFVPLLSGFIIFSIAFFYYSRMHPHGFEDAWSMWNYVARFVYRSNSAEIFLNPSFYERFHQDYPVEQSLNVAWGWFNLNSDTPQAPMALAFLTATISPLMAWAALWKWKNILTGTLGAIFIIFTLDIEIAISQYADTLLIAYLLPATLLLYGYLKSKSSGILLIAGLLAGYSAWVKNGGILFAVVFSIVCLLASLKHAIEPPAIKRLLIGLFLPSAIVIRLYRK